MYKYRELESEFAELMPKSIGQLSGAIRLVFETTIIYNQRNISHMGKVGGKEIMQVLQ